MARGQRGLHFKVVRAHAFTAHDEDDLFQEIATQVWNSIPQFRAESTETTSLYRVALNSSLTLLQSIAAHYPPERRETMGFSASAIEQQLAQFLSPWFVKLIACEAAPVLRQIRCRVLALNGEKDIQVACQENLAAIREGIRAGGNSGVTTHALPGLNHLFQHCDSGAVSEYGTIEETMSPEVLRIVGEWILQRPPD